MKKILFVLLILLTCNTLFSQKQTNDTLFKQNNATQKKAVRDNNLFSISTNELINLAKQQNGLVEIKDGDTIIATRTWKVVRGTYKKNIDPVNLRDSLNSPTMRESNTSTNK